MYENLGKTHFILGYTPETIQASIRSHESVEKSTPTTEDSFNFMCDDGGVKHVFFTPDDHVQKKLLHLIQQEKKSIKITAYAFTNGDVAQEVANAARRKVAVEMVVDPNVLQDSYSKIEIVYEAHVPIFVYNPQYHDHACLDKKRKKAGKFTSLMHNKFIIFGKNIADKKLVWTGSCNLTNAALRPRDQVGNQENVLLTDEPRFVKKYEAQFEKLKERSKPYDEIKNAVYFFKRR